MAPTKAKRITRSNTSPATYTMVNRSSSLRRLPKGGSTRCIAVSKDAFSNLTRPEQKRYDKLSEDGFCADIINAQEVVCACGRDITLDRRYKFYLLPWYKHKNRCAQVRAHYFSQGLDMPLEYLAAEYGKEMANEIMKDKACGLIKELTSAPNFKPSDRKSARSPDSVSSMSMSMSTTFPSSETFGSVDDSPSESPTVFFPVLTVSPDDTLTCERINLALPRVTIDDRESVRGGSPDQKDTACVVDDDSRIDERYRPHFPLKSYFHFA